jgi:hypothetical protein
LTKHANRLARWQRLTLYITGTLLLITGVLWLALHYSIGAGAGELPHPIEVWSMRLHGLAAFAGLFFFGVLAAIHIPRGWKYSLQPNWTGQRKTGVALCVLAVVLAVTGYMLYYFAPETVRPALGWGHAFAGTAMGALVFIHRHGSSRLH